MYAFELSERFLSDEETRLLTPGLSSLGLDERIWKVFACLFRSAVNGTTALVLRAQENGTLCGAAIVIKCCRNGKALFNNRSFAWIMDLIGVPCYLWLKFGSCMDMMSNPGYVIDPAQAADLHAAMTRFLRENTILTIIYDLTSNAADHDGADVLPAMPHAAVNTEGMSSISDYLKEHKSLKRKPNEFRNKGGSIEIIHGALEPDDVDALKRCFTLSANRSVIYLPYQDLYLSVVRTASTSSLDGVYYFVARLNGRFIGYQAAIKTGNVLNTMHGAFDRTLRTTHHAYDCIIHAMVEFAVNHRLTVVDYGTVVNETKRRLMTRVTEMHYFLGSRYRVVQWFFSRFLKFTRIQSREQLQYCAME